MSLIQSMEQISQYLMQVMLILQDLLFQMAYYQKKENKMNQAGVLK